MKRIIIYGIIAALACTALAGCAKKGCVCQTETVAENNVTYRVAPPPGKSRMPKETKALQENLEKALQQKGIAGNSGWTVKPMIIENPKKTGRMAVDVSIFAPDGKPTKDFCVRCWDSQHWSGCRTAIAEEIAETLANEKAPVR